MNRNICILLTAVVFTFIACTNPSSNSSGGMAGNSDSSQTQTNLAKNRSIYKALETGDAKVIDSLIADDAVDHQGPNGNEIKGGDSIKHVLIDMHNHVKDLSFSVTTEAANDDYIFTLVHMTGTTSDNSFGMPAGSKMDNNSVDVVKIKNGKMIEHWGFVDPNEMMKAMQHMPASDQKSQPAK